MNTPDRLRGISERALQLTTSRRNLPPALYATGAALSAACQDQPQPRALSQNEPNPQTPLTWESWQQMSASERLNIIQNKSLRPSAYQELPSMEPLRELAQAVAQVYCQEIDCVKSPEQLAQSVFFLNGKEFSTQYNREIIESGGSPLEQGKQKFFYAITTNDKRRILINTELIDAEVENLRDKNPILPPKLATIDLRTIFYKSTLIHEFTHADTPDFIYPVEPYQVLLPNGPATIDHLQGFTLVGKDSSGKTIYINGSNEAITEAISTYAGSADGSIYLSLGYRFGSAADMIIELCEIAGVSRKDLKNIRTEHDLDQLLSKWGSIKNSGNPDKKAALRALTAIGIFVNGIITYEQAQAIIYRALFDKEFNP
ncbi:hypothetical protein HYU92_03820 [Candidatus Curtissbacteria bacterium]|nr:hypothetical protein [Candidatus Curtissbacteria bacterium]